MFFFFQAEDGIRDLVRSRGLGDVYKRQGYAGAALAPEWFTVAPVEAIRRLLKQTGLSIGDIDLFEINEAFSAVSLAINLSLIHI
mgnify:CR=1 FL=1